MDVLYCCCYLRLEYVESRDGKNPVTAHRRGTVNHCEERRSYWTRESRATSEPSLLGLPQAKTGLEEAVSTYPTHYLSHTMPREPDDALLVRLSCQP